jgi:hypothetical protein
VIGQATAIGAPVSVCDDRLLIVFRVIDLNQPTWVDALRVPVAFENQRFDPMLTRAVFALVATRLVVQRLKQGSNRANGDALSPSLAQH